MVGAKIPYRNKRERAVTVTQTRERWSVLGWGGLHVCAEGGTMSRSPTGGPRSFLEGGAVAAVPDIYRYTKVVTFSQKNQNTYGKLL